MAERHHPGGLRVPRVGADHEPELGREARADVLPAAPAVGGSVNAAVVLLVEAIRIAGGHHELVDALAGLRVGVRRVAVGHAAVSRLPARAAVLGGERADRADRDPHPIRVVGWGTIVWQMSPPAPGDQPGPARVVAEGRHVGPRGAVVVAAEEAGRLDAGVDRAVRRRDVPDGRDLLAIVAVRHALGQVRPRLAEVVGPETAGPYQEEPPPA